MYKTVLWRSVPYTDTLQSHQAGSVQGWGALCLFQSGMAVPWTWTPEECPEGDTLAWCSFHSSLAIHLKMPSGIFSPIKMYRSKESCWLTRRWGGLDTLPHLVQGFPAVREAWDFLPRGRGSGRGWAKRKAVLSPVPCSVLHGLSMPPGLAELLPRLEVAVCCKSKEVQFSLWVVWCSRLSVTEWGVDTDAEHRCRYLKNNKWPLRSLHFLRLNTE